MQGQKKKGKERNISDPWGYNMNTYRMCAAEISLCVDKIIEKLTKVGAKIELI